MFKSYVIEDIGDIFYAGMDSTGQLYIFKKIKKIEKHRKYGIE